MPSWTSSFEIKKSTYQDQFSKFNIRHQIAKKNLKKIQNGTFALITLEYPHVANSKLPNLRLVGI